MRTIPSSGRTDGEIMKFFWPRMGLYQIRHTALASTLARAADRACATTRLVEFVYRVSPNPPFKAGLRARFARFPTFHGWPIRLQVGEFLLPNQVFSRRRYGHLSEGQA